MAFNKVFIILALASCAMAMPVHQADLKSPKSIDAETTSASIDIDSTTVEEQTKAVEITKDADSATEKNVIVAVDGDLVKRSIEDDSSAIVAGNSDSDNEDMETAAGTNVLRPLFVYRQQVAYRQRVRNSNRRDNRRF